MSDKAEDVHSELLMLYTNSINEINVSALLTTPLRLGSH